MLQEGGAGAAARQLVALLAWRALGPISDAARRLLVVACPNDRLVSFRCSERIAAHYGARRAAARPRQRSGRAPSRLFVVPHALRSNGNDARVIFLLSQAHQPSVSRARRQL